MVKDIVKDVLFLGKISTEATKEDLYIGQDLIDTITLHKDGCVGMAANMIGYLKNVIVVDCKGKYVVMYNPVIIKTFGDVYTVNEGCLSLEGVRETKRYKKIKVQWLDENWKVKVKTFNDFEAQIIQHEIDHCQGIII